MNLPTEIFGDVVVVHAPDELNDEQSNRFQKFVLEQGRARIVVDLDSVEMLDSAGLTVLLNIQEHLQDSSGDLKLIAAHAVNRKILEITRLDQNFEVFDSVIEAVKSFG